MYIKVKVAANAKKEEIQKLKEDSFSIQVKQKAERNMANNRVREILGAYFNLPISKIRIINGHTSPGKLLSIDIEED